MRTLSEETYPENIVFTKRQYYTSWGLSMHAYEIFDTYISYTMAPSHILEVIQVSPLADSSF
jgi:hypothetical protein